MAYTLLRINSILTLALATPANLFLIWLILCRTSGALQKWSRVLLQSAVIDLTLALFSFIIQPVATAEGSRLFWVILGPFANINNTTLLYAGGFFHSFLLNLSKYAIAVPYFYRWLVICREREISISQYVAFLCVPILFTILHIVILAITFARQASNSVVNSDRSEVYIFCYDPNADGIFGQMPSLCISAINVSTFVIVIICNSLIWCRTRHSVLPDQQRSMEISRQVGRVLLIQAILPIALTLIPTLAFSLSFIVGSGFSSWASFLFSQTWTSCIYPVATMAIIGNYRREIKKLILIKSCCMNTTNSGVYPSME